MEKLTEEELAKADAEADAFIDELAGDDEELRAVMKEMKQTIREAAIAGREPPSAREFLARYK